MVFGINNIAKKVGKNLEDYGYHTIKYSVDDIFVTISIELVEKFEEYNKNRFLFNRKLMNPKDPIVENDPYYFKIFDKSGIIKGFVIEENNIKVIGKISIDLLMEYITRYTYIKDNPVLFEDIYRIVVKQLLERGWPIECVIMKRADWSYGEFFVLGPYIPYFERDMGFESLFAYIQKDGIVSKMANEDESPFFYRPRVIYINNQDAKELKLVPNEKVLVWFFHGNI